MPDLSTFGGRLEDAIKRHGPRPPGQPGAEGSVKGFHEAVQPKIPAGAGSSYQTLYRLLGNRATPSDAFIDAALSVLRGVRREWLVDGQGERTEGAEAVTRAVEADVAEAIGEAVVEWLGQELPPFPTLPLWSRAVIFEAVRRHAAADLVTLADLADDEVAEESKPAAVDAAFNVANILRATLDETETRFGYLTEDQRAGLLADVARALMSLAPNGG